VFRLIVAVPLGPRRWQARTAPCLVVATVPVPAVFRWPPRAAAALPAAIPADRRQRLKRLVPGRPCRRGLSRSLLPARPAAPVPGRPPASAAAARLLIALAIARAWGSRSPVLSAGLCRIAAHVLLVIRTPPRLRPVQVRPVAAGCGSGSRVV